MDDRPGVPVHGSCTDATDGDLPPGWFRRWRMATPVATADGTPSTVPMPDVAEGARSVTLRLPEGIWYPRLEIWRPGTPTEANPNPPPVLASSAEIHRLVVEKGVMDPINPARPGTTRSELPTRRHGSLFVARVDPAPAWFDARVRVRPAASGGGRARVSPDGYPQNEYWIGADDTTDPGQVIPVHDAANPTPYYVQGYGDGSAAADDLTLVIDAQHPADGNISGWLPMREAKLRAIATSPRIAVAGGATTRATKGDTPP